jgi:small subunit ribosomal protein S1
VHLEGKELEFKVIKLDQKRNNVVVSRRAVIESENRAVNAAQINECTVVSEVLNDTFDFHAFLQVFQQLIALNLTDYGAFVDLGGVDGLLHITDMAWKRVKHPSEIVVPSG